MGSIERFLQSLSLAGLRDILLAAAVAVLCIGVHELCHGLAAWKLGDPTAKNAGRLTLNPLRHIDPIGLLMMVTVRVGWAKPVPVDTRYFKHPRRDMALTALAGPVSNFVLAFLALALAAPIYEYAPVGAVRGWSVLILCYIAMMSVGLGVFNLIPLPPLDGSKILFSLLPERMYYAILRRERWLAFLVMALLWSGILNGPLSFVVSNVLRGLCAATGFPYWQLSFLFF